jgi:hypothetical protein
MSTAVPTAIDARSQAKADRGQTRQSLQRTPGCGRRPPRIRPNAGESRWNAGESRWNAGESRWNAGESRWNAGESRWNAGESRSSAGEISAKAGAAAFSQVASQALRRSKPGSHRTSMSETKSADSARSNSS